jgi:hypothetical protein
MLRKFDAATKQQLTKKIRYVVDFEDWLEEIEVFVLLQQLRPRSKNATTQQTRHYRHINSTLPPYTHVHICTPIQPMSHPSSEFMRRPAALPCDARRSRADACAQRQRRASVVARKIHRAPLLLAARLLRTEGRRGHEHHRSLPACCRGSAWSRGGQARGTASGRRRAATRGHRQGRR